MYLGVPITIKDYDNLTQCIMFNITNNIDAETLVSVVRQSFKIKFPPELESDVVSPVLVSNIVNVLSNITNRADYESLVKIYLILRPHLINPELENSFLKDYNGKPVVLKIPIQIEDENPNSENTDKKIVNKSKSKK